MTKVYLVYFQGYDEESKSVTKVVFNVFTNKKKAEIYAEYKQLQAQIEKPDYLEKYTNITYKVEEWRITQCDFTDLLTELQIKNLPF